MKSVFTLAAVATAVTDDCSTNELKCRAAVVTSTTCFAFKTNVVTDKNKDAEFERHENEYTSRLQATIDTNKHYLEADFTVTKIEAKYPEDVNNYVINQQNSMGRLFYEVSWQLRLETRLF